MRATALAALPPDPDRLPWVLLWVEDLDDREFLRSILHQAGFPVKICKGFFDVSAQMPNATALVIDSSSRYRLAQKLLGPSRVTFFLVCDHQPDWLHPTFALVRPLTHEQLLG